MANYNLPDLAKTHRPNIVSVAYGATLAPNVDILDHNGIYRIGPLTGNLTLNAPIGTPVDGQQFLIQGQQDATGGRTITWNAAYEFTEDVTSASVTTTLSRYFDVLVRYHSGRAKWVVQAINND